MGFRFDQTMDRTDAVLGTRFNADTEEASTEKLVVELRRYGKGGPKIHIERFKKRKQDPINHWGFCKTGRFSLDEFTWLVNLAATTLRPHLLKDAEPVKMGSAPPPLDKYAETIAKRRYDQLEPEMFPPPAKTPSLVKRFAQVGICLLCDHAGAEHACPGGYFYRTLKTLGGQPTAETHCIRVSAGPLDPSYFNADDFIVVSQ